MLQADSSFSPDKKVGIAVDSSAPLGAQLLARHRVAIAPMTIHIGDDAFPDAVDLNTIDLYRDLSRNPNQRAWLSAPTPESWLEAIEYAAEGVDGVLCMTVASGLSASFDSARVAAEMARNRLPNVKVRVLDSGLVSGGFALLVTDTLRQVDLEFDLDTVHDIAEATKSRIHTIASLDSLTRIHHIARLPRYALRLAQLLHLKPVISYDDDGFNAVAKPFTKNASNRAMLRRLHDQLGDQPARFMVLHADAPERATALASEIREQFDCQLMILSDIHPFIGIHAGRGTVGITWQQLDSA